MNNITKGDILRFANSYDCIRMKDKKLKESIGYIIDVCYKYFLHFKPYDHILTELEYNLVLYNNHPIYEAVDLRPIFENYMKSYLREQLLNELLNE